MKNKLNLLLLLTLMLFLILGCRPSDSQNQTKDKNLLSVDSKFERNHGAKIIVQYSPEKDETTVFQQDFKIEPEIVVNEKPLPEKHTIEFHSTASFKGRTPNPPISGISFTIFHNVLSKKQWQFPPKTKVLIITDNDRIELPVYQQSGLEKDNPKDKEFYETLIVEANFEMYSKISNAQKVEFQFGQGKFILPSESVLAFKDFTQQITTKN